jgi:hypothetical protein
MVGWSEKIRYSEREFQIPFIIILYMKVLNDVIFKTNKQISKQTNK